MKIRSPYVRRGDKTITFYLAMCSQCFWDSSLCPTLALAKAAARKHLNDVRIQYRAMVFSAPLGMNHPCYIYTGLASRLITKEQRRIT